MATKQTSMKAKKQQKAKERQKGLVQKRNPQAKKPTEAQLRQAIAKRGLIETARKYRKVLDKGNLEKGPSNIDISASFMNFIDMMVPIHSLVEMADYLVKEGKITFTDEEKARIAEFDDKIVKSCEDVTAINGFMADGLTFKDFPELYVHFAELAAEMALTTGPDLFNEVLKPYGDMLTTYAREHKLTGEKDMDYAMRLHDTRMKTIVPLYRTLQFDEIAVPEEKDGGVCQEFEGLPPEEASEAIPASTPVEGDK